MDPEEQVHNRWTKISIWLKSPIVRIVATWTVILLAGVFAINQLQSYLIDSRQAVLYQQTYVSVEPFGPRLVSVPAGQYPSYLWLNYKADVPKQCQVSSDLLIRKRYTKNNQEYLITSTLNNGHSEGRAQPTDHGQLRNLSLSVQLTNINPVFKTEGAYEIQRISRFQCGTTRASNLTSVQVVGFNVIH